MIRFKIVFLFCVTLLSVVAFRHIAFGQIFKHDDMPVIISGKVASAKEVPAPTQELFLAEQDTVLELKVSISHGWKGLKSGDATLYTTIQKKKPCPGYEPETGKSYIFWGQYDSKKNIQFFSCGDFLAEDDISAPDMHKKLDKTFP